MRQLLCIRVTHLLSSKESYFNPEPIEILAMFYEPKPVDSVLGPPYGVGRRWGQPPASTTIRVRTTTVIEHANN